jgi:hypothetical protein
MDHINQMDVYYEQKKRYFTEYAPNSTETNVNVFSKINAKMHKIEFSVYEGLYFLVLSN